MTSESPRRLVQAGLSSPSVLIGGLPEPPAGFGQFAVTLLRGKPPLSSARALLSTAVESAPTVRALFKALL